MVKSAEWKLSWNQSSLQKVSEMLKKDCEIKFHINLNAKH